MVTKLELTDRLTELAEREVLLEYTVQKLYELVEIFASHSARRMIIDDQAFDVALHLYSNAEVRVDIEDYVNVEIEYEEEK